MRSSTILAALAAPTWALSAVLVIEDPERLKGFTYYPLTVAAVITILYALALHSEAHELADVDHVPDAWAAQFGDHATQLARAVQAGRAQIGSLYLSRPELRVPALVSVGGAAVDIIATTDDAPTIDTRSVIVRPAARSEFETVIGIDESDEYERDGPFFRRLADLAEEAFRTGTWTVEN